ncbi:MAG: hypothetical protein CL567_00785 [Alphaproteobacteria bacterium]|nr:hypothetical protein [Alphaproteobacteria bacterium]|tara:strand:+ start:1239 stop:1997 length:759 start_codon:yes stop_codon:yes gene_type:complete
MKEIITLIIEDLLLPPCGSLILLALAYTIRKKYKKTANIALITGIVTIYLVNTPFLSTIISIPLIANPAIENPTNLNGAEAIVVLGGGLRKSASEYLGIDTIDGNALERVRYGAYLKKNSGLPVLLTGGITASSTSEARAMSNTLKNEFNVLATWLEEKSMNTKENAKFSWEILSKEKIFKIVLVTNDYHMQRSVLEFESVGFQIIPGPVNPTNDFNIRLLSFLPNGKSLNSFKTYVHEWLGILWYYIGKNL